jgi:hypothetical protein
VQRDAAFLKAAEVSEQQIGEHWGDMQRQHVCFQLNSEAWAA